MRVRTIKRNNKKNIVVFAPDNGQGARLELTQRELLQLAGMLQRLHAAAHDGTDHQVEDRESTFKFFTLRGM